MRTAVLGLFLLATTCSTTRAAPDDYCVSPSCAEHTIDAPAGDYASYTFTSNLGATGYFRANVTITAIRSHATWQPFCSLSVSAKGGEKADSDSMRISLFKHPDRRIDFSIKTVRRDKLIRDDELPGNFSVGTTVPLGISWKPGEFEITFGNQRKTYKSAFTPRWAYLACSTAAGKFENIETAQDTKGDACDDALHSLNKGQEQDSAKETELIAAYRKERDNGNRQQAHDMHCNMRAITIKDQIERLETFKNVVRLCHRDRITTSCDLNCRAQFLQATVKAAKSECGENVTSRASAVELRDPPAVEPTPVAPAPTSTWPTEGKRVPNFYGTTW